MNDRPRLAATFVLIGVLPLGVSSLGCGSGRASTGDVNAEAGSSNDAAAHGDASALPDAAPTGADASRSDAESVDAGSDGPPDGGPGGTIEFEDFQGGSPGEAYANFWSKPGDEWLGWTEKLATGACVVRETHSPSPPLPDSGMPYDSAGALDFDAPLLGGPEAAGQDSLGGYTLTVSQGPIFAPGDVLSVSASGAAVPAFTQTIQGPPPIVLRSPASPFTVPTDQDLVVSWDGGIAGDVVDVLLDGTFPNYRTDVITCTFDAVKGEGTVPKSALAFVKSPTFGTLGWMQRAHRWFQAGAYWVDIGAAQSDDAQATFQ